LYLTPVIYPADLLGEWAGWLDVNPVTGVVELFHAGAMGTAIEWRSLALSLAMIVVLLIASASGHRRYDRLFIDLL
jgi:ABC-type polysaccharide/polyol phosphate export permease